MLQAFSIGPSKICYVYVDDVIIFSKTDEDHVKDVDWVLTKLLEAGMSVSQEKSKFFKKIVEYLGFIVSQGGPHLRSRK